MSKKTFHPGIVNQVDLILFEEGVFSPLNWLLREGHVSYRVYQSWRLGDIAYLEDHFSKESKLLILLLKQAYHYAKSQSLEISTQCYASKTGLPLYFCRCSANDIIFATVFKPPLNQMQMDLFFDSSLICTESDLKRAVIDKQMGEIPRLLSQLKNLNLEKYQQFLQLIALEKELLQSELASDKKIKRLGNATALAFEIFGQHSHEFLTPLWQKLSVDLEGQSFNTKFPDNHISYTATQGFLWPQVISSIEKENGWTKQPVLLFRYAEACFKLDKEQHGLVNWFKLFILFPEDAEKLVEQTCSQMIITNWQSFCELEPELSCSIFPAWLVMNKPALAKNTMLSDIKECVALRLIMDLVFNSASEIDETIISLRTKLKKHSPALFSQYMRLNQSS